MNEIDLNRIQSIVVRYNRDHNIKNDQGINYNKLVSGNMSDFGVDEVRAHTHKGASDPEHDLMEMVGLDKVKKQVLKLKSRLEFFKNSGESQEYLSGNHMCLLGPPGTGKTTVARIMAGILYENGCTRTNTIIETDAEYFKSSDDFIKKTEKTISGAMGGTLFIDEAYLLLGDRKGYEIMAMLLKAMEDARDEFVVIFAGYENEMKQMVDSNPGMKSRIKNVIYFPQYNPDELCRILIDMGKKLKLPFSFETEALNLLNQQFEIECKRTDFANARDCRNILDKLVDIHTYNYMNGLDNDNRYTITRSDVQEYVEDRSEQIKRDYVIVDHDNGDWEIEPI